MKDVFLLGAGFSRQISSKMPLLRELGAWVHDDVPGRGGPHSAPEMFEEWLSYLSQEQPWLSESRNLSNRAMFLEATESVRRNLVQAQLEVLQEESIPLWFRRLVALWHRTKATVATLNYDTLVEAAYTETVRVFGRPGDNYVAHSQLYPIPFTPLDARHGGPLGISQIETFDLVKLHGSLNWKYSGRSGYYGETIYDEGLAEGWKPYVRPGRGRPLFESEKVSLIVPPTAGKSGFFENETVRAQWEITYGALFDAKDIYIIGYSLPISDLLTRSLLEAACKKKRVFPVNIARDAHEHFKRLLPGSRVQKKYVRDDALTALVEDLCSNDDNDRHPVVQLP